MIVFLHQSIETEQIQYLLKSNTETIKLVDMWWIYLRAQKIQNRILYCIASVERSIEQQMKH